MRAANFFTLGLAVTFLASCSSVRVRSDYIRGTDFKQFKTYQVVHPEMDLPVGVNPINQQRIETTIKATLTDYEYLYADQQPDLLVSYFVIIKTGQASHNSG